MSWYLVKHRDNFTVPYLTLPNLTLSSIETFVIPLQKIWQLRVLSPYVQPSSWKTSPCRFTAATYSSGAQPHLYHVPLSPGEKYDVALSQMYYNKYIFTTSHQVTRLEKN